MKNRNKNKKKQWKHLLKELGSDLKTAKENELISTGDFVIQKRDKLQVRKGDKEAAKDHPEFITASSKSNKQPYRKGKSTIFNTPIDVWEGESKNTAPKPITDSEPVCLAGQSYHPSAVDHQLLLMHIAKEEKRREKKENPHKISKRQIKLPKKSEKVLLVNKKVKKPTPKQLTKKMKTDLENIPKILKEIKKQKNATHLKKTKRDALTAIRMQENKPKFQTAFQLPGELSSSLRKLKTDENWMREIEFIRNKLPRARKSLNINKSTTSYIRRK